MTTQTASYHFGYALGTVTREFLRAVKQSKPAAAPGKSLVAERAMPAAVPHPSGQVLEHMCQVPAIVRLKQVDLNAWYEANTREAQVKKPRRTRTRRPKEKPAESTIPVLRMGSLDELIAPVAEEPPVGNFGTTTPA